MEAQKRKSIFRVMGIALMTFILAFSSMFFVACKKDDDDDGVGYVPVVFGEFGYMNKYLIDFATEDITAVEAKQMLSSSTGTQSLNLSPNIEKVASKPSVPTSKVQYILSEYSSCVVTTKYYVEGIDDQQTKQDTLQGTDFRSVIETNEITPFSQLVAKNLIAFPELIDYMEQSNQEFRSSELALVAPYRDIFTYHKNERGELVIKTRDFAEIPASVGGGIGCSFRQDSEILYDADMKITKWQTSLGLWSTTPKGTMKQGYILEVEFNWIKKV